MIIKTRIIDWFSVSLFFVLTVTVPTMAKEITAPLITAPFIDGQVEKAEWQKASVDSGFIQVQPYRGLSSTEKTIIRVGMDGENLYVAFKCLTGNRETISAGNPQRDRGDMQTDDSIVLLIDSFHDRRSAYLFHVNVLNTQTDHQFLFDKRSFFKNIHTTSFG